MARDPQELHRLAQELAALTPEERARVISEATGRERDRPIPRDFVPPELGEGGKWIGGSLSREEIYGDDGR